MVDGLTSFSDCAWLPLLVVGLLSYVLFIRTRKMSGGRGLSIEWFKIKNVPADNNCMFHAILRQISDDFDNPQNIDSMRATIAKYAHELDESFRGAVKNIENPKTWGNEICLVLLAYKLKLCFLVYRNGVFQLINNTTINIYSEKNVPPECLEFIYLYNDETAVHFQILEPLPQHAKQIHHEAKKMLQDMTIRKCMEVRAENIEKM